MYWLVLGVLAVWRVTHLLVAEDGPWDLVLRLRRTAGSGFFGRLLDCFYCSSLWVALPLAFVIGQSALERLILWPALSGGAILLERATFTAAVYTEDEAVDDAMLRSAKSRPQGDETATRED